MTFQVNIDGAGAAIRLLAGVECQNLGVGSKPCADLEFNNSHIALRPIPRAFAVDDQGAAVVLGHGGVEEIDKFQPSIPFAEAVEIEYRGGTDFTLGEMLEQTGFQIGGVAGDAFRGVTDNGKCGIVIPADNRTGFGWECKDVRIRWWWHFRGWWC